MLGDSRALDRSSAGGEAIPALRADCVGCLDRGAYKPINKNSAYWVWPFVITISLDESGTWYMDGKIIQFSKAWAYLHDNPVIMEQQIM